MPGWANSRNVRDPHSSAGAARNPVNVALCFSVLYFAYVTPAFALDPNDFFTGVDQINSEISSGTDDLFALGWYFSLFCAWTMGFARGLTR